MHKIVIVKRPLWRSCGDVDLFFDANNYERAKTLLTPLATSVEPEEKRKKHLAMIIDSWLVELHGLMPTEISRRINVGVEKVQSDIFENGGVRIWNNDGVEVPESSRFLTFNYTRVLEDVYHIPEKDILHIHGVIGGINEKLIVGHKVKANESDAYDESAPIYQEESMINIINIMNACRKPTEDIIARNIFSSVS